MTFTSSHISSHHITSHHITSHHITSHCIASKKNPRKGKPTFEAGVPATTSKTPKEPCKFSPGST
jgi:hypothetical protein